MRDCGAESFGTRRVGSPPAAGIAHTPFTPATRIRPSGCQSAHQIVNWFSGTRETRDGFRSATAVDQSSLPMKNPIFNPSGEKNPPLAPLSATVRSSERLSARRTRVEPFDVVMLNRRCVPSAETTGAASEVWGSLELVMETMFESVGPITETRIVPSGVGPASPFPRRPATTASAAMTTSAPIVRGSLSQPRQPATPAARASPAIDATVKRASCSASANAFALSNRSAGNFSSDLATAAATFVGTAFRYFVTASAGSVMIFMMICCAFAPVCGGLPVSISYSTLPIE